MKRHLNVLIVEDSEPDARLLIRELKLGGFEVAHQRIETADGLKQALATGTWDVILCDYMLPNFSGGEALRMVKESNFDLPFIFVSGKIGEETAVQAMKTGAHDYVMKNNLARLAAAVDRELGEAQIRRESRQAETMMRISEHKYRHLFESMRDAAFLVAERAGKIIDVNRQAELLLGRTRAEIIGMNQRELYPSQSAPPFSLPPGETVGGEEGSFEVEIVRRDGSIVPTDLRLSRIQLHGHDLLLLLFRDIARRRQTEKELRDSREQLRALAARLQAVREEERTRVAREIHDELGQMLTAIKMDLRWIEDDLERVNDPRLNPVLDKAVAATELTDALARSVQRIAAELRPGILDRLGLMMALTHEAEQFQQRTGVQCRLKAPEDEPLLPIEAATAVFRIFQEAMTNVARHANASAVEIELELSPRFLTLKISDNGGGIKPSDLLGGHSLGVLGMQERARHLGGEITFQAGPAAGTLVTLLIPLPQDQKNQKASCSK
jgi:two-component system sensor histidine kinase UhpB